MDRAQVVHELYRTHAADLIMQVYGLTGDYAGAQDVVHEAFARALIAPPSFDELDNPRAWLSVVALNLSRSAARRRHVYLRLVRSGRLAPPVPAPGMSPDRVAVVAALQRISRRLREAVVLHYLVDLPVDEVASILGVTPSGVRSRLQRGRQELAELLRPQEADDLARVEEYRRRRRRRTGIGAVTAAAAVIAVAGIRLLPATAAGHDQQRSIAPPPVTAATPDVPFHHAEVPFPATAASLDRLYLPYYDCLGSACGGRIAVSVDGGRSWTKVQPPDMPQPATLLGVVPFGPLDAVLQVMSSSTVSNLVTTDGGQTWRLAVTGAPISAVPPSWHPLWLGDGMMNSNRPGTAVAVDPKAGVVRTLANQPSVVTNGKFAAVGDGTAGFWVGGVDESGRAVVAVSHNAGGSWQTHSFPGLGYPVLATVDGSTGYVFINPQEGPPPSSWGALRSQFTAAPAQPAVADIWVTRDGGANWERLSVIPPAGQVTGAVALLDGSLLLRVRATDGSIVNYRGTGTAKSFAVTPNGPGVSIEAVGPNAYVATDQPADAHPVTGVKPNGAYLSTDREHWNTVTYPQLP